MPERQAGAVEWNWDGARPRVFPTALLALFNMPTKDIPAYVGYVGFQNRGGQLRSTMTSRFGPGRSTTYRY
jgi:hypothetical protein